MLKLVWNPKERWGYDFLFVGTAVFFGVLIARVGNRLLLAIAFMVAVLALREVLYHYLVRRKRSSAKDAT